MAIIDLRDGENLETALKKFKRLVQRENILREHRAHAYFVRPGERDRLKRSIAQRRRNSKRPSRFSATTDARPRRPASRRTELPSIAYEKPVTPDEALEAAKAAPTAPTQVAAVAETPLAASA